MSRRIGTPLVEVAGRPRIMPKTLPPQPTPEPEQAPVEAPEKKEPVTVGAEGG
jgi:hypothetical protein